LFPGVLGYSLIHVKEKKR